MKTEKENALRRHRPVESTNVIEANIGRILHFTVTDIELPFHPTYEAT